MGIRFYCPNGHKLNVKEFQAGRKGICPFCGVKMRIPLESTRPSTKGAGGESSSPPPKEGNGEGSGDTVWEFDFLDDLPQAVSPLNPFLPRRRPKARRARGTSNRLPRRLPQRLHG